MHTQNSIRLYGTAKDVLQWVSSVDRWPDYFPHYRWVRVHERNNGGVTATMAAKHGGLPIQWTSVLKLTGASWPLPLATFHHIGGITKGMDVQWLARPYDRRELELSIVHELDWPAGSRWFAQKIIGDVFVKGVASKTLRMVKHYVERKIVPKE